ncbi:MAG: 16S rRNA (guanine(527)-N(7))-methyltransferase RsmG [Pseudomonadota bacterium]
MNREAVADQLDLTDDELARLDVYVALLEKWQAKLNLVGPKTLVEVWQRHVLDSAQLRPLIPESARNLVDMGSGAGFPGLVLAALGITGVTLIDSDARKCVFLREAARAMEVAVDVRTARLERTPQAPVDVLTARALAPLGLLLRFGEGFIGPDTRCLFLKGERAHGELTEASVEWMMKVNLHPSLAHELGVVVELTHVQPR